MENKLAVAEMFLSLQGEGRTMGTPAFFLRLAACNLMCGGHGTEKDKQLHNGATWRCDTIEVWKKGKTYTFSELLDEMEKYNFSELMRNGVHLIITGGEPLIQQKRIVAFIEWMSKTHGINPVIEIETNGTMLPDPFLLTYVMFFNVSPKLRNSGMSKKACIFPGVLQGFNMFQSSIFKFVISSENDWEEAEEIINQCKLTRRKIWLMPAASNMQDLLKVNKIVANICIKNKLKFSTRLQIEIWDQTTGV